MEKIDMVGCKREGDTIVILDLCLVSVLSNDSRRWTMFGRLWPIQSHLDFKINFLFYDAKCFDRYVCISAFSVC